MIGRTWGWVSVVLFVNAYVSAQRIGGTPHLGYLYPAGAQRGTTLEIVAGGQNLRGADAVYVTGEGVRATVIEYIRPLSPNERVIIGRYIRDRVRELQGMRPKRNDEKQSEQEPLPDHPLAKGLEMKGLQELLELLGQLFSRKTQLNAQIAETVILEVAIDPNAAPGDRELRLATPTGITNPMVFQVGVLPEIQEDEPNDPRPILNAVGRVVLNVPVLLNGQIMPGDVDRFRFRATQGQRLVIETQARHLVPYLADAVPGWFQATLALFDAQGREIAFTDDYYYSPDPVLFYEVPKSAEYELEVHDSLYRGREDFVYRITIGEQPFITEWFPLGGPVGVPTVANLGGWNLPNKQLALDTQPGAPSIRQAALVEGDLRSNRVTYAVGELPECEEAEPNDDAGKAQVVALPHLINGRLARVGDVDVFRFTGRAGEEIVAEVQARVLGSPVDSLVRLIDSAGNVVAWNDDYMPSEPGFLYTGPGLLTHHADSYLSASLPRDGAYCVELSDAQRQGGSAYAYRLRLSAPRPDFALRVTPSSVSIPAGRAAPLCIHVSRKDGFAKGIEIRLKDAPAGFELQGARIPPGRDSIRMTLSSPRAWIKEPFILQLEGQAIVDGQPITRPVEPCEDMMQAFLYRHLVSSQQFMVQVIGEGRFAPTVTLAQPVPVRLPTGGVAQVHVNATGGPLLRNVHLELDRPPTGITLQQTSVIPGGLQLQLKAAAEAPPVGYEDNLIVNVFLEVEIRDRQGQPTGRKQRLALGTLPAIPFEIVQG